MSQITSPVILDSTGVRIAEAIEALSGGGGGGGSSDIYTSTFRLMFMELNNDETVCLLPETRIVTALAPVSEDNQYSMNRSEIVIPVALAILQGETSYTKLTTAQAVNLNNTPDPTSLNFFIYNVPFVPGDPSSSPIGYGLTNIVLHIGNNVYKFDTGDEMFVLQGTFNPVDAQSDVYLEIENPGDYIQIYNV